MSLPSNAHAKNSHAQGLFDGIAGSYEWPAEFLSLTLLKDAANGKASETSSDATESISCSWWRRGRVERSLFDTNCHGPITWRITQVARAVGGRGSRRRFGRSQLATPRLTRLS